MILFGGKISNNLSTATETKKYLEKKYIKGVGPKISRFYRLRPKYNATILRRKVKSIQLQAWTGPEGSKRLRLPDFKTIST
jgi:hypothetical protein